VRRARDAATIRRARKETGLGQGLRPALSLSGGIL